MASDHDPFELRDPNWGRYLVQGTQAPVPLGDAQGWGSRQTGALPQAGPILSLTQPPVQLVSAATKDRYSRPWVLAGTISINRTEWENSPAPGSFNIEPFLELKMGVARAVIVQRMRVRGLVELLVGTNPFVVPSGVYFPVTDGALVAYPFYAAGIVAQSLSISVDFFISNPALIAVPNFAVSVAVTPYNAGTGL